MTTARMRLDHATEILTGAGHCGDVHWVVSYNGLGAMAAGFPRGGKGEPIRLSAEDAIRLAEGYLAEKGG